MSLTHHILYMMRGKVNLQTFKDNPDIIAFTNGKLPKIKPIRLLVVVCSWLLIKFTDFHAMCILLFYMER
jgi:hypothetical protein